MRACVGVVAAAACLLAAAAGAGAAVGQFQGTVATVGGESITAQEVRLLRERTDLKHNTMGLSARDINATALEMAVRRRLILLDAKKGKQLDGDLGDRVKAVAVPAYARYYRKVRLGEVKVSDKEIELQAPDFAMERRRVSYIVSTSEEAARAARARADAGEDFARLAAEYSEGPASEKGGDLGWLEKAQNRYFSPEQWETIFKLPKGGLTQVFPSILFAEAWALAKVVDIERYSPHEVAEMRNAIGQQLREQKVAAEFAALVKAAALTIPEGSAAAAAKADRGAVLATFTGGKVTAGEFRGYLKRMLLDPAAVDAASRRQHLQDYGEMAVVAAKKEPELNKRKGFREEARQAIDEATVKAYLELLYERVTVTDADVERAYYQRPEKNQRPEQVELWQIRIATREEADEAYQRLKRGEEFESVAQLFAQTQEERSKAGLVGLVSLATLPGAMGSTVSALKVMEVSQPLAERFGYYIFQVRQKIDAKQLTLREREAAIRAELLEERKVKAFEDTLARLKGEFKVKVDNAALDKI